MSFVLINALKTIGFSSVSDNLITGGETEAYRKIKRFSQKIEKYDTTRDFVNLNGTSNLSTYIRFGCLSIRDCVKFSLKSNENGSKTWLSELIWREFLFNDSICIPKIKYVFALRMYMKK